MLEPRSSDTSYEQVVQIPLSERWQVYQRLQDLKIPCSCFSDGSLRVQVNSCITALLLRSTLMQIQKPRQELIEWLERCWKHIDC
jgi:hypothetical protein